MTDRPFCALIAIVNSQWIIITFATAAIIACKPGGPPLDVGKNQPLPSIVLFKVGNLQADGKAAVVGETLPGNIQVETGKHSLGDIQLKEYGTVLRLQNEIKVRMTARKYGTRLLLETVMGQGTISVSASRREKHQQIRVTSPVAIASVRGTKFSVAHDSGGTLIEVHSGKVAVRPLFSDMERLPLEVLDRCRTYQAVRNELARLETILEGGNRLKVTDALKKRIAAQVPELKGILGRRDVKAFIDKRGISEAQAKVIAGAVDERFPSATARNKLTAAIRSAATGRGTTPEKMPAGELTRKLKQYEELIALEKSKLKGAEAKANIAAHNKARTTKLMKRIEKIMGKRGQTLYFKGGGEVFGVIITRGNDYLILTPGGSRLVPGAKVDSIGF